MKTENYLGVKPLFTGQPTRNSQKTILYAATMVIFPRQKEFLTNDLYQTQMYTYIYTIHHNTKLRANEEGY